MNREGDLKGMGRWRESEGRKEKQSKQRERGGKGSYGSFDVQRAETKGCVFLRASQADHL